MKLVQVDGYPEARHATYKRVTFRVRSSAWARLRNRLLFNVRDTVEFELIAACRPGTIPVRVVAREEL